MAIKYETARLLISEADQGDGTFIYDLLNSPGWIKHIGDRNIKTLEDAEGYIQNSLLNHYKIHGFGLYKLQQKTDLKPIGIAGLLQRPILKKPDIGFALLPDFEGFGFVTEACQTIINDAENHGIDVIYGITTSSNTRSKNVLTKLGMRWIGHVQLTENGETLMQYSNDKTL